MKNIILILLLVLSILWNIINIYTLKKRKNEEILSTVKSIAISLNIQKNKDFSIKYYKVFSFLTAKGKGCLVVVTKWNADCYIKISSLTKACKSCKNAA